MQNYAAKAVAGAGVEDALGELRLILAEHMAMATASGFRGVMRKRAYYWLERATRLVAFLQAGGPFKARPDCHAPWDAYAALRNAAHDIIQNCHWLAEVDLRAFREFIAAIPTGVPNTPYRFSTDWLARDSTARWEVQLAHLRGAEGATILEVGSFEGKSACWFLDNILTAASSRLSCIDRQFQDVFAENIERTGATDRVEVIEAPSCDGLRQLAGRSFDAIYIDGSHRSRDVLEDAVLAWPLLKVHGLMIFDDYQLNEIKNRIYPPGYLDHIDEPHLAIDAFLRCYQHEIQLVFRGKQVIVTKVPPRQCSSARQGASTSAAAGHSVLSSLFRHLAILEMKVTLGCNLPCRYCNMDAQKPTAQRMSLSLFRDTVELLMTSTNVARPCVEFHGGEPLLLPDRWYEEAVAIAQALAKQHAKSVRFRMVTNGLSLSDTRIACLSRLGIELCLSLDGPPEINDRYRGGGELVAQAVRRLQAQRVPFAMLAVITDANVDKMPQVLDYFASLGVEQIQSSFFQPQGRGLLMTALTSEGKLTAIKAILSHMAATDGAVRDTYALRMVRRFLMGRPEHPALACDEKECLAGRSLIAVDPAGELYACPTDMVNHRLGNIYAGIEREHVNRTLVALHHKDAWYERCIECDAKVICDFNCPTSHFNNPRARDGECSYTKALYRYLGDHRDLAEGIHAALPVKGAKKGARRLNVLR